MGKDIINAIFKNRTITAHRGARALAPENSLEAAKKALEAGAWMWETDVRLSLDGELVLIHDPTLKRTSNVAQIFPGRDPFDVHDFTLAELKLLDFGSWFKKVDPFGQIAAGKVSSSDLLTYSGRPVVTLEEAILFTIRNDWLLNIEIKDLSGQKGHNSIVEKILHLVLSLEATRRVLISSFNHHYLRRIKDLDKNVRTGVLVDSPQSNPLKLMEDLEAFTFNPGLRAIRPWQIRALKQKGFGVLVWVVNNPRLAEALFLMGVNGIFTDFPQRFSGYNPQPTKLNRL